jgi:hypothetical protein
MLCFGLGLHNRTAFVKAATRTCSMKQLWRAAVRAGAERWLFQLVMGSALIAAGA